MAKPKVRNPQTLEEYLNNLTVENLRKLAGHLPGVMPTHKGDLVATIFKGMMNGDGLTRLWARLDELQRAAVAEVVHGATNRFDASTFRAKYGADPDWGISRYGYGGVTNPSTLGLFFYGQEMPVDLKAALIRFVPKPRQVEIKTVEHLPDQVTLTMHRWQSRQNQSAPLVLLTVRDTQLMAQHDLLAVLRLVEAGQVPVTAKTQRPTATTVRAIAEVLEGGDYYPPPDTDEDDNAATPTAPGFMRAFAWPLILQSASLAEAAGSKLQLTVTGKQALSAPASKTLYTAWNRWLKTTLVDEFNRIKTVKGQTGKGENSMTACPPRRKAIAQTLAELPLNTWVEFDEFSRYMQAAGHSFTISRDLWTLYVEDANYGSLGYEGFGEWHIVQARYLLVFLMEYAATLGLIDIAYIPPANARLDFDDLWGVDDLDAFSDYDGLRYIRLNHLGAWVLGLLDSYQPPVITPQKLFNILPNHDLVVLGALPASDRLVIERFAQQTAERVWHIDLTKLLEAHEADLTIDQVRKFLEAKSNTGLPQTVAVLLQESGEKIARLRSVELAQLFEVSDSHTMQLLANESRLAKYCLPAGDHHLVVPAKSLSAFRRALHELGYALPRQEG